MAVTPLMVKELREKTGAGMLDCKKALEASNCDIEEAIKWLREKGIAKAEKKANRVAAEGLCSYAFNGNSAVVFEVNSETDFVAQNEKFVTLINNVGEVIANSDAQCTDCALALDVNGKPLKYCGCQIKPGIKTKFFYINETTNEKFYLIATVREMEDLDNDKYELIKIKE